MRRSAPEARRAGVVFAIIRFSRRLGVGLSREDERALTHRHPDIYLNGLSTLRPHDRPLPAPPALQRRTG